VGRTIEGRAVGAGRRFALVVSRFNDFVTSRLQRSARQELAERGVAPEDVDEIVVPGAFEIPLAAQEAARSGRYAAVICLGAVIRGATAHFEYVAGECARGVARVSVETGVPAIFGVLTTDTPAQALERAGGAAGDKGRDAARAALEMADLLDALRRA
jgi:6,7-dimethyl-8-ribityllumazine synthase